MGQGVEKSVLYVNDLDAMISFDFQDRAANLCDLDGVYREYFAKLAGDPGYNVFSYISSHDTKLFPRGRLIDGSTALLLAPRWVQVVYGDETARPPGPFTNSDSQQAMRSDMNWNAIKDSVLAHWARLTQSRARYRAFARVSANPYVFSRVAASGGDRILAAIGVNGEQELSVGDIFANGVRLRDAYTGCEVTVSGGKMKVLSDGAVLLEATP